MSRAVAWPGDAVLALETEPTTGAARAYVVTPTVASAARAFFNCSALPGAELENQPTGAGQSCWGSHWDERVYQTAVMSPLSQDDNYLSALTLALYEDSGWYRANFSSRLLGVPAWGFMAGCGFATGPCLVGGADGALPAPVAHPFCNGDDSATDGTGLLGCSADYRALAYCATSTWSSDLDDRYQYFSADAALGGYMQEADFCPFLVGYSNGDCTDASYGAATDAIYGNAFGDGAACMIADLIDEHYFISTPFVHGCFAFECDATVAGRLDVVVGAASATCDADGASVTFAGFDGAVTCPPYGILCGRAGWSSPAGAAASPAPTATRAPTAQPTTSPPTTPPTTPVPTVTPAPTSMVISAAPRRARAAARASLLVATCGALAALAL